MSLAGDRQQRPDAQQWLRETLAAGAVPSARVKKLAAGAGIGAKGLINARKGLGVVFTRRGFGAEMHSVWSLPAEDLRAAAFRALAETLPVRAPAFAALVPAAEEPPTQTLTPSASALDGLDENERNRARRSAARFVQFGMTEDAALDLGARLAVQRDRRSSKEGSCAECTNLAADGASCAPGRAGHLQGPRPLPEIWMCWSARRP